MTGAATSAHMGSMESTQPSTPTVAGDTIARLALAQDPDTGSQTLWQLIDDPNTTIANTARDRLGLALRPLEPLQVSA